MKKKTLVKSYPKNLIKELMLLEGLKSQVKIGDMREVIKRLGKILATPMANNPLAVEFGDYICDLHEKDYGVPISFEFAIHYVNKVDQHKATDNYFAKREKLKKKTEVICKRKKAKKGCK